MQNDLQQRLAFIHEIDKVKQVFRQTYLLDGQRFENDAEHSWHLAVMAITLQDYAPPGCDITRVVRMVLLHDLVEIDAGDTYLYDTVAMADKPAREQAAADRIFGILPSEVRDEFRALWDEFEARKTPEARFAGALDRLQPLMHNYLTEGRAWREHGITADQVLAKSRTVAEGSFILGAHAAALIEDAVARGYLKPARTGNHATRDIP